MTLFSINWRGFWTLYQKEIYRFCKVYNQTLLAPTITSLLFLAIFHLAMADHVMHIANIPFSNFMASGLVIMAVVQNAFANTSSTIVMGKVLGNIIDLMMPPLSPLELSSALLLGGMTRGFLVGILVTLSMSFFIPLTLYNASYALFHLFAASCVLALLGMLAGIIAESFDQMAAITSYVITPLSFLSGTFYSVANLPPFLQTISHLNPFFYMIDGFRYGMTGYHESNLTIGIIYLLMTIVSLWSVVLIMFKRGYRLRS
jgi:ABC-2 type transport system permease protein